METSSNTSIPSYGRLVQAIHVSFGLLYSSHTVASIITSLWLKEVPTIFFLLFKTSSSSLTHVFSCTFQSSCLITSYVYNVHPCLYLIHLWQLHNAMLNCQLGVNDLVYIFSNPPNTCLWLVNVRSRVLERHIIHHQIELLVLYSKKPILDLKIFRNKEINQSENKYTHTNTSDSTHEEANWYTHTLFYMFSVKEKVSQKIDTEIGLV